MDNHRNCTYYAEFHNTKWLRMGCLQWYNRTKNTYRNFLFIGSVILIVMLLIVGLCSCKDIKKMLFHFRFFFFFKIFSKKYLDIKVCWSKTSVWVNQQSSIGVPWSVLQQPNKQSLSINSPSPAPPFVGFPPPRGRGSESSCKP